MTNQQGAPEALRLADALCKRVAESSTLSWFDGDLAYAAAELRHLHAETERLAALVEAQQPAKAESLRQILTDPENQPNQYGVQFLMHGAKMAFRIGARQFTLDYEPTEPGEFEFMRDALIDAFSVFTPDVKMAQQPSPTPQADSQPAPIDMVLHCPACGMQHIDAPDSRTLRWKIGDRALTPFGVGTISRVSSGTGFTEYYFSDLTLPPDRHAVNERDIQWPNEPHRSHLCHGCGHIWRPADVPTNGVKAVKTTGKADSPIAARAPADSVLEDAARLAKITQAQAGAVNDAELIRRMLEKLELFDDAGPLGEGWQSNELEELLAAARSRLEKAP